MPQRAMSKCERRSRKTAALLAAWTTIPGNSRFAASARGAKRPSCSSKKSESGSSAVAKWVQTPTGLEIGALGAGAQQVEHLRRIAAAEPAHAAVVLDVHSRRPAVSASPRGEKVEKAAPPDSHLRAGLERRVQLLRVSAPIVSRGTCCEAAPIRSASLAGRHRQPRRPARQRRSAQASAPWP
jgi:hypothetical protein